MSRFRISALAITRKDLVSEWRRRETVPLTALFGALVVVVASLALEAGAVEAERVRAGILWTALTFAFVLGVGRTFESEREHDAMRGLLASPVERAALYLGKFLANVVLLAAPGIVILAVFALLHGLGSATATAQAALSLAAVLLLGAAGFAGVGTLFAGLTLGLRARDALLSVLMFPLLVPLLLAGSRSTAVLMRDGTLAGDAFWPALMVVYDLVFVVVALIVFEYVVEK